MKFREIKTVVSGNPAQDGAGVKLVRVLGLRTVKDFDPFLMLDAFDSHNPEDYINGFPWHPHRGIETVTYLIEGGIEHGDSMGNKGTINDGCCQWMTAGSGIIHQEMPQASPAMLGLQLWINLPAKDKMTAPAYRDIRAQDIATIKEDGAEIKVISGQYKDTTAKMTGDYVKTLYLDVNLMPNKVWSLKTNPQDNMFLYIFSGDLLIDDQKAHAKTAALLTFGDNLAITAGEKGARFVLVAGQPLKEPVAWGGPIVMNTEEELNTAFEELDNGAFIKENHPKNAL